MSNKILLKISKIVLEKFGLFYDKDRFSFFQKKIDERISLLKLCSYSDYYNYLLLDKNQKEFSFLLNILTVNETFFFRHYQHFLALKNIIIPELLKKNEYKTLRIWSAGCSNGCETYSIAIIIKEIFPFILSKGINNVEILGTDVSKQVINQAKTGVFLNRSVKMEMPDDYLTKYFSQIDENYYSINDDIKNMVNFCVINLKDFIYPEDLHIVFFRNVLYYFDTVTQSKMIYNVYKSMLNTGFLFLGGTEVCNYPDYFQTINNNKTVYYQKWSTNRRKDEDCDDKRGRQSAKLWKSPEIIFDDSNKQILFKGIFAENCDFENISYEIMFNAGLSDYYHSKELVFNFQNVKWITNNMIRKLKSVFKFYKSKNIKIIIFVGENNDILNWLKSAKFNDVAQITTNYNNLTNKYYDFNVQSENILKKSVKEILVESNNNFKNTDNCLKDNPYNIYTNLKKNKVPNNNIDSSMIIHNNINDMTNKNTNSSSCSSNIRNNTNPNELSNIKLKKTECNTFVINKCDENELKSLKTCILNTLMLNTKLFVDISNAKSVCSELFNIVNKANSSSDTTGLIKIIE